MSSLVAGRGAAAVRASFARGAGLFQLTGAMLERQFACSFRDWRRFCTSFCSSEAAARSERWSVQARRRRALPRQQIASSLSDAIMNYEYYLGIGLRAAQFFGGLAAAFTMRRCRRGPVRGRELRRRPPRGGQREAGQLTKSSARLRGRPEW